MHLIVEPTEFAAQLVCASVGHDSLVFKDSRAITWEITEDELARFWAATIAMRNGTALPSVRQATTSWFLTVRPLTILYSPGFSWPL